MAGVPFALVASVLAGAAAPTQVLAGAAAPTQASFLEAAGRSLRGFSARTALLAGKGGQVPPLSVPNSSTPIHLLISAFQDGQRCANTISRALLQADHPQRVSFNVLQAEGAGDVDCLQEFKDRHLPKLCSDGSCAPSVLARVHFWKIPRREGKGPVHQRGLLTERADLSGKDSMCLSTDSHMDFTKGWDSDLLEDWAAADNEFAVLSAYPLATADAAIAGKASWISLCGYFLMGGVPRGATGGTMMNSEGSRRKPTLTMNWAAGQSFSRCHAERNVPVDKHLAWMFNGEEVNRAVRLWTHGYDLYNPGVNVVLHNYSHASQAFWSYESPASSDGEASSERLQALLQGRAAARDFGKYGLGSQRSLEDYVAWSHTDLGGSWKSFLEGKGIEPMFAKENGMGGLQQPGSRADFCSSLRRLPVRSAEDLVASAAP